jgi:hypothetical protein
MVSTGAISGTVVGFFIYYRTGCKMRWPDCVTNWALQGILGVIMEASCFI